MPRKKLTVEDVAAKLKEHGGNMSQVAHDLNVNRSSIKRKVDSSPSLTELAEEIELKRLDECREKLFELATFGNYKAIISYLELFGRKDDKQSISIEGITIELINKEKKDKS